MSALQAKYPDKAPKAGRADQPRRHPLRRAAGLLAKIFAGLLLLCIAAVGGALVWLRTPAAETLILDETTKALTGQGMNFSAARLSGPLPQRIAIDDLSLADARGPLLRAKRVELRWSMAALLRGTVEVEAVELDDPEIFRLPASAPEAKEEEKPESGGSFSLPVTIRLDGLRLQGGRVHAAVLRPGAAADEPPIAVAVSGSAVAGPSGLSASLRCGVIRRDSGLTLDLRLENGPEDRLELHVIGEERPGGLLALLLDKPDLPAGRLRLNGTGSLKDWKAELSLLAGAAGGAGTADSGAAAFGAAAGQTVSPDVLDVSATLNLRCATGSLLTDMVAKPDFTLNLTAGAKPGKATPPDLLPLLGGDAKIGLEASVAGPRYSLKAEAGAAAWSLRLPAAEIRPGDAAGTQLFTANLQAAVTDLAAFAGGSGKDKTKGFPLDKAAVTASLRGRLGADSNALTLDGQLETRGGGHDFKADYTAEAETQGQRASLRRLELRGLGITLEAKAEADTASGAVRAEADILAADKSEWQALVSRLAGFTNADSQGSATGGGSRDNAAGTGSQGNAAGTDSPLGGELRLNASLNLPGKAVGGEEKNADSENTSPPANNGGKAPSADGGGDAVPGNARTGGLLRLTGSGMRWPTAQLTGMLGPSLNVSARLSPGEDGKTWLLALEDTRAGIFSASGKAAFTPPEPEGQPVTGNSPAGGNNPATSSALAGGKSPADGGKATGDKGGNIAASSAPAAAGGASAAPFPGRLEAKVRAQVSDLAPLGPGLAGAVTATVKASGPLNALDVTLNADSPALTAPNGVFRGFSLALATHCAMTPAEPGEPDRAGLQGKAAGATEGEAGSSAGNDIALSGSLSLKATDSPGGPLSLSGRWQADLPADGRVISAGVSDFLVQGAGVKLTASLSGLMRNAQPQAAGSAPAPVASAQAAAGSKTSGQAGTGQMPLVSLKGELNADVHDWSRIAALSGAPLSGGPASLRLRLDNAGGGQSAALDLSLQSLVMEEAGGQPSLSLESVSASLNVPRIVLDGSSPLASLAPDFRLRLGPGLAGPLRWSGGNANVKGQAGAGEFFLALNPAAAPSARSDKKSGAAAAELLALRGRYDLNRQEATVSALSMSIPPLTGGPSQASGRANGGFRLQKPLNLKFADGLQLAGLDMAFQPGGRLTADASLVPGNMRVKAALQTLPFTFFALFTDAPLPGGELGLTADITTSVQGPRGNVTVKSRIKPAGSQTGLVKANADNNGAPAPGAPAEALDLNMTAALAANAVSGSGVFGRASAPDGSKEGKLAFRIPLRPSPDGTPAPDSRAPMTASLRWDGSVAPLWRAVPVPDRYLSGQLLLDATVTGTMDAPRPALAAYLGQGRYEDIAAGVLLTDIALEAKLTPDGNLNALLAAGDGRKGTLALEAALRGLMGKAAPHLAVRGQLNDLKPLHRDDLSIALSGIFGVTGPADAPAVTADIRVDQGELTLSSSLGGSVTTLDVVDASGVGSGPRNADQASEAGGRTTAGQKKPVAPKAGKEPEVGKTVATAKAEAGKTAASASVATGKTAAGKTSGKAGGKAAASGRDTKAAAPAVSGPSLDVRVAIPRQFFIRGMGLDSEWEGDLRISGAAADLSLIGALRPVRGHLDILSKTFEFTGGDIGFTGGMRANPLINLELTYVGPSVTAIIRAAGSAKKPKLVLESRPPLPRDEILAQVIFGKRTSELSRFEAIQLANSLRELTNTGGSSLDVLTGMRKTVGLDVLRVGSQKEASQRTTSGQSGDSDLTGPQNDGSQGEGTPSLEAGKYINDSIYIGVEQGTTPDSTAVRVEVELFPSVNLQGQSSATATEVGVGWKKDY